MNRRDINRAVAGFVMSLILTMTAYSLVVNGALQSWTLAYVVIGLAMLQLLVQLIFFLHLGCEKGQRWSLLAFSFTLVVIIIVVIGSVWIMKNLHYKMSPQESRNVEQQLLEKEGIRRER